MHGCWGLGEFVFFGGGGGSMDRPGYPANALHIRYCKVIDYVAVAVVRCS